MSVNPIDGSVLGRPDRAAHIDLLALSSVSTASSVDMFFDQYVANWRRLVLVIKNIEKPSGNAESWQGLISTNAASFESAAAYNVQVQGWTATVALASTGLVGATGTFLTMGGGNVAALVAGNLATATGKGGAEMIIYFDDLTATTRPQVRWEMFFTNSASSPGMQSGNGYFASGPLRGFSFQAGGTNFSANAELYGIGRTTV